jgi:hypothetical protein
MRGGRCRVANPAPHYFGKLDQDPDPQNKNEKLDQDPQNKNEKLDQDPHQSQISRL